MSQEEKGERLNFSLSTLAMGVHDVRCLGAECKVYGMCHQENGSRQTLNGLRLHRIDVKDSRTLVPSDLAAPDALGRL